MKHGYITSEFWAVLSFLVLSLIFERTWIVLAIDAVVVIAYVFSRTKVKELPGVKNYHIMK